MINTSQRYKVTLTLLASLLLANLCSSVALAQNAKWIHTWIAPPSTLPPSAEALANQENFYNNQTLRLTAHTSIGGSKLRVRIGNTHGEKMLNLAGATVALQAGGGGIVTESLQTLTFAGNPSVSVPQGAVMLSDGLDFAVPAMANLSLSLYFAETTPFKTLHSNANQLAWVAAGNQLAAAELKGAKEVTSWDFLSAIEVQTTDKVTIIAAVGDSITDGYLSTIGANARWPNFLARRLQQEYPKRQFAVLNAGIGGNRVLRQASPRFGQNLLARLDRDVFSIQGLSHMVLLEGINDIGMGSRTPSEKVTAQELIDSYRQVIARAHARGIKIFGATLLPYEGASYYSEEGESVRRQVNQWIRNGGEYDGYFEFELATRDPDKPTQLRRDFTTDNLHPNDAGYRAMAEAVDLSVFNH
jgi:lysophospholipase L1-like esterase